MMEIPLLKLLLNNISGFFHLSSRESINSELVGKYYQRIEEILKLLKTILDAISDVEIASGDVLQKAFAGLNQSLHELRELFDGVQPLMSRVYFVIQVESLTSKVRNFSLEICDFLKSLGLSLPNELAAASVEQCVQKILQASYEQLSPIIMKSMKSQVEGSGVGSDHLAEIANCLSLSSNQELLLELVSLEKLKENAEQAESTEEVDYIDQIIALVTYMHETLVMKEQSNICTPVQIPADFCCPLSLQLMTDPVIVASGQTYERAFIKKWIDLGLNVCPKTRQTLAHTNLIPNYTVKALISNWCETNNIKLPDPMKSGSFNPPSLVHIDTPPRDFQALSLTRDDHSTSPDSSRLLSSPRRNLVGSSGMQRERSSPSHVYSSSEDSLPSIAENEQGLDTDSMSVRSPEGMLTTPGARSLNSAGHLSVSPSESNGAEPYEQSSQGHSRSTSAPSTLSNSKFSHELPAKGATHVPSPVAASSSDSSDKSKSETQPSTALIAPRRDPEIPTRLETRHRTHTIWRRPSERYVPRIVSSPAAETRNDLSEVDSQVRKLVEDLRSGSLDAQREATAQLRVLARHNMDNRIIIANCGAISLLVDLLHSPDRQVQENAVTALLNLSINDNNKTAIANAEAIEPLIHVLKTGSPEAKENSAATLFSLSVIEENKAKIGRSGAIEPLVDLLGNGTPRGKKDAATALFNLSILHENKPRIVQAGAVKYLVDLMDPAVGMVDKAVAVLSNLATIHEGRIAIGQEGGIRVLVEVVELGSARGKENAAAALLQLCTNSNRFCNMVLQEGAVPPLVALSLSGTPRAREKAHSLLSFFRNQRHGNAGRN